MNWIRKTFIFLTFLIIAFFAAQANQTIVQKIESKKSDSNFSKDYVETSDFIQPQTTYCFTANIKTSQPNLTKWFDSLLVLIPHHKAVKSSPNFTNQYSLQSKNVSILLYPFHYFW